MLNPHILLFAFSSNPISISSQDKFMNATMIVSCKLGQSDFSSCI